MNEVDRFPGAAPFSAGDRLEELLRTAVDEQVGEQRQLAELLTQVRAALNAAPAASPAVPDHAETPAIQVLHRLEQTQAAVARIGEEMAAVHLAAARLDHPTDLQDVQDGLAGVRTDLRTLPEQMGAAAAGAVGAGLRDVGRLLTAMEQAQETLAGELVAVRGELAAQRPALDALAHTTGVGVRGPDAAEIAEIVREGVRDATRDFVRDYLRDAVQATLRDEVQDTLREAVQEIVTVSTRDTERRITEHVDEAVLALAQAMLRRRPALAAFIEGEPDSPPTATTAADAVSPAAAADAVSPRAAATAPEVAAAPEPGPARPAALARRRGLFRRR